MDMSHVDMLASLLPHPKGYVSSIQVCSTMGKAQLCILGLT